MEINKNLEKYLLDNLPTEGDNLYKSITTYANLCLKLRYSIDYYKHDNKFIIDKYQNGETIATIDGSLNSDVVCYFFNYIFVKFLLDHNLCDPETREKNGAVLFDKDTEKLLNVGSHSRLCVLFNGVEYRVDSTPNFFADLVLLKFKGEEISGWKLSNEFITNNDNETVLKEQLKLKDKINLVNEKIFSIQKYESLYNLENSKANKKLGAGFDYRVKLFMNMITLSPDYSMESIAYIAKLESALFNYDEREGKIQKEEVKFVLDNSSGKREMKMLFLVNNKGYINDYGFENFKDLFIAEYSLANKKFKKLTRKEILQNIEGSIYTNREGGKPLVDMVQDGKLELTYLTDKKSNSSLLNTVAILRTFHNGRTQLWPIDEGLEVWSGKNILTYRNITQKEEELLEAIKNAASSM